MATDSNICLKNQKGLVSFSPKETASTYKDGKILVKGYPLSWKGLEKWKQILL